MLDKIFIKDLIIEMSVGIYEHEKASKQRVIINIILDVESNAGKSLASIDDVVSYENIVNQIKDATTEKHYDLLEELAEKIAETCKNEDKVHKATISLEKPDIIYNTRSVGIEIIR